MTNIYLRFGKIWKCWPQKAAGHTRPSKAVAFKKNLTCELSLFTCEKECRKVYSYKKKWEVK